MEVSCEDLEKVLIGSDPERFFQVGSELPPQEKSTLIDFLRQNVDVFVWDTYEAPGVDPDFICHHLNVNLAVTPKKQPHWRPSKEHADVVREEVTKLKKAGAIKECSFGVGSWKFLGYMVTHRGIEVNPDQIRAIHSLQPPRNPKEVQNLTGMIAALNRFISRSANRYRPFFLLLNKWKGFEWTEECALAFQQLKEYLARPPIMSSPEADEVLFAYVAVAFHAVSLVLIREDNGKQRPVYYVSKSLHEAEIRYLPLENAVLAISADYMGRIAKWGTILGAFDIRYMPRTAVKGQVLADLVAEFAEPILEGGGGSLSPDGKLINAITQQEPSWWKAHVDSAANQRGSGVGLVLVSPEGITIEKSLRLGFSATNNEAEYEALLEGMSMIQKLGGKSANIFSDSRLIVGQVNGELEAKDERMQEYLAQVKRLQTHFCHFYLAHVSRSGNTHTDSLATLATSSAQPFPWVILVEDFYRPTTTRANKIQVHNVRAGPS
ncbi:uncharacterized protein LOC115961886 [Quercus lobata]|uniref:uncharacterized protein LOC115961886 n=1 Tax=Quercus lobata TaxID=97700 RepID=UPI001247F95D|nr:uncharacterized protein LOC115961886 [Quercus lobata]